MTSRLLLYLCIHYRDRRGVFVFLSDRLVGWLAPRRTAYRELLKGLNVRGVHIVTAQSGQAFDLGDDARLNVVAASVPGATLRPTWLGRIKRNACSRTMLQSAIGCQENEFVSAPA